jgi:hypothetical protein
MPAKSGISKEYVRGNRRPIEAARKANSVNVKETYGGKFNVTVWMGGRTRSEYRNITQKQGPWSRQIYRQKQD